MRSQLSLVEHKIKDCSKVRNNEACGNLLQLLAIPLHFQIFQFLFEHFSLLDPDPHIECESGSRRKNECGSTALILYLMFCTHQQRQLSEKSSCHVCCLSININTQIPMIISMCRLNQCFGSIFIESGSGSGSSQKSQSGSRKALNPDPSYFFTLSEKKN